MRQLRHSLSLLAACAQQQRSAAAAVEVAVAQHGSLMQFTARTAAGIKAASGALQPCYRFLTVSAAAEQAVGELPDKGDSYYWLPPVEEQPFTFDRRGIYERRATGRKGQGTGITAVTFQSPRGVSSRRRGGSCTSAPTLP